MVKVRTTVELKTPNERDIAAWLDQVAEHVHDFDRAKTQQACELVSRIEKDSLKQAEHTWGSEAGCFRIGVEMATILVELDIDGTGLLAAILYRAVREEWLPLSRVRSEYGRPVAHLIEGVLRMAVISRTSEHLTGSVFGQHEEQRQNIRKMLVAMVDDVRVALIKLAERTCAIRFAKTSDEPTRLRVAREVFDIYAPLAHRLGIGHLKWELEDLSFRSLYADAYKKIARLLDEKRVERETYVEQVKTQLVDSLAAAGVHAEVSGRVKHIYSIWRKMQKKNIDFYQIYDIRAVRVLVDQVADCYAALGIVHGSWQHIPKEFDDYIATPKENGYRSLHTAVLGPGSKVLEVQIRTHQMHEEAELGVCAHWHYKEGTLSKGEAYEQKIAWLRQVLEWQEALGNEDVQELLGELRTDVVDERIYVFTPEGHVVDMVVGATPLDFAYHVHTEVGHRCRGAKVNDQMVSLKQPLKTGDCVEILTSKEDSPSRDWLNPHLSFVKTARAKAKIQQWFKLQDRDRNLLDGRHLIERELTRLRLPTPNWSLVAAEMKLSGEEELFVGLGASNIRTGQVLNVIQVLSKSEPETAAFDTSLPKVRKNPVVTASQGLVVEGMSNMMLHLAGCCQPVPGDAVVGYVSLGRGVSVHRANCTELELLRAQHPDRLLAVDWQLDTDARYPVKIELSATDRSGLLKDVSTVMANMSVNVVHMHTDSIESRQTARMQLTVEIGSLSQLGSLLMRLSQLPGVYAVNRQL